MSDIDLKPCPFCGGEAELVEADHSTSYTFVECKKCWGRGPQHMPNDYRKNGAAIAESYNMAVDDAVQDWNNQTLRRQNEKLREKLDRAEDVAIETREGLKEAVKRNFSREQIEKILEEVDNG